MGVNKRIYNILYKRSRTSVMYYFVLDFDKLDAVSLVRASLM